MKALKVSEFLIVISSSNHVSRSFAKLGPQLRTVRNYGVCSRHVVWRREMVMPIGRFIIWVGTSLLALLFVARLVLPNSLSEQHHDASNKPIIRIASIQQPQNALSLTPASHHSPATNAGREHNSKRVTRTTAIVRLSDSASDSNRRDRKGGRALSGRAKVAAYQPPLASPLLPRVAPLPTTRR